MNNRKRLCFLALVVLCIFAIMVSALSCDTVKESNVTIKYRSDVLIISSISKTIANGDGVDFTLDIVDKNTTFKAIEASRDVSGWLYIPGVDTRGIVLKVKNAVPNGASSITLNANVVISSNASTSAIGTTLTSPIVEKTFYLRVPSEFINDRLNDVIVENAGVLTLVNIIGQNSSSYIRFLTGTPSTAFSGNVGDELVPFTFTYQLNNNTFNQDLSKDNFDVSGWFSPCIKGLNYALTNDVKKGDNTVSFTITGTPKVAYSGRLPLHIDRSVLTTPNRYMYCVEGPKTTIENVSSAYISEKDKEIKGITTLSSEDYNVNDYVTIKLSTDTFKALTDKQDVSSWALNAVSGLKYEVSGAVSDKATQAIIHIYGAPTSPSTEKIKFRIPYAALNTTRDSSIISNAQYMDVDPKGTKYAIEKSDFYSWRLFDLATFSDMTATTLSENRDMTTQADGTALSYDPTTGVIAESDSKVGGATVTYTGGFKRHGFVLKGFTFRYREDTKEVDPNYIVWRWTNEDFTEGGGSVSVDENLWTPNIADLIQGRQIDIFAVWEPDSSGVTFDENYDEVPTTKWWVKEDTSEGGKYLPGTYKKPEGDKKHIDQNFYNEVKIPAKGYKALVAYNRNSNFDMYVSPMSQDIAIFDNDFAVAEHVITGYIVDELRKWNIGNGTLEDPEKGYAIPSEEKYTSLYDVTADDDNNKVVYGYKQPSSVSSGFSLIVPINDSSEPVILSMTQALVIANALTEYYNEKRSGEENFVPLTFAYTTDGNAQTDDLSNVVKTISDATLCYDRSQKFGDPSTGILTATGFRLPTNAEWDFAARVVPKNDYSTLAARNIQDDSFAKFTGTMYPQYQLVNQASGARLPEYTGTPSTSQLYSQYKDYAYSYFTSYVADFRSTHGFIVKEGTIIDKLPNNIGLYAMNGNVSEIVDFTVGAYSTFPGEYLRWARGGNAFNSRTSHTKIDEVVRSARCYGIRLVRTLN